MQPQAPQSSLAEHEQATKDVTPAANASAAQPTSLGDTSDLTPENQPEGTLGKANDAAKLVSSGPTSSSTTDSSASDSKSLTSENQEYVSWEAEDDWGKPTTHDPELQRLVAKIADEQLSASRGQRVLPLFVLVLALFAAGWGMLQGAMLLKNPDPAYVHAQMQGLAGRFSTWGAPGCALWYGLSSLAGSLAILIPVAVYYRIGRKNAQSRHVGLAIYDFLRAEALKYGLIVVILGCFLKFTELRPAMMLTSFAVMTILELILRLWALPKADPLTKYYHKK